MSRGISVVVALALIVAAAMSVGPSPVSAAARTSPTGVSWQSAGDSYSSGEGVAGNQGACAQSDQAYGPQAAQRLIGRGWDIANETFTACTGHLVEDFFNERPDADGKKSLWEWGKEQGGPDRVDVLAMSFGGNDVGFGDIVTQCVKLRCNVSLATLKQRADWLLDPAARDCAETRRSSQRFDCGLKLSANRGSIIDFYTELVRDRLSDRGRLYVVGYPRLFAPPDEWPWWEGRLCAGVNVDDTRMLGDAADYLNAQLVAAVKRANESLGSERVVFVDRLATYRDGGHELCGKGEDWLNGISISRGGGGIRLRYETSFHPNAAGHSAVADALVERAVATFPEDKPARSGEPAISDPGELSVEFVRRTLQGGDLAALADPDTVNSFAATVEAAGESLPRGAESSVRLGEEFSQVIPDSDGGACQLLGDVSGACVVVVEQAGKPDVRRLVLVSWSLLRDDSPYAYGADGLIRWPDGREVAGSELRPEVGGAELLEPGVEQQPPTTRVDSLTLFNSPSGNIGCALSQNSVRCDIRDRAWAAPSATCPFGDATLDYGNGLVIGSTGDPSFTCAGDTVLGDHQILEFGSVIESPSFRCLSTESGMACTRLSDGHGFTISREQFEFR